jgi:hypothetical protein
MAASTPAADEADRDETHSDADAAVRPAMTPTGCGADR